MEAAEIRSNNHEESLIDEIRRDPDGYRGRISAFYGAEAAEWVEQEMRRRIQTDRKKRRQSLRRKLLSRLSLGSKAA
jgi:hypothetical protein